MTPILLILNIHILHYNKEDPNLDQDGITNDFLNIIDFFLYYININNQMADDGGADVFLYNILEIRVYIRGSTSSINRGIMKNIICIGSIWCFLS